MNEAQISFTGNATADAELKYVGAGPVANFSVAVTPRRKVDGQWVDGQPAFYRVAAWQQLAENAAESIRMGDRVTVVGRLEPREYEHEGQKRTSLDVNADSVALDLRFATATAVKAQRQVGGQPQQQGGWGGAPQQAAQQPPPQPRPQGYGAPQQPGYDSEPPF